MQKVKTESGFVAEIDERIINDWRFVSAITDTMDDDDTVQLKGTRNISKLLLGADGERKLCEHIAKQNDGFVPTQAIMMEISAIINALKESKN